MSSTSDPTFLRKAGLPLTGSQVQTLDFKSAAAMPEFNLVDPLAHVTGKRAVPWKQDVLKERSAWAWQQGGIMIAI